MIYIVTYSDTVRSTSIHNIYFVYPAPEFQTKLSYNKSQFGTDKMKSDPDKHQIAIYSVYALQLDGKS